MPGTFSASSTRSSLRWPAAESAGAPSRTSATRSGAALFFVARAMSRDASGASELGSSKSPLESSSPNTGPPKKPATSTTASEPHRKRRRRR